MNVPYSGMEKGFRPVWVVRYVPIIPGNDNLQDFLNELSQEDYEIVSINTVYRHSIDSHSYTPVSNPMDGTNELVMTTSSRSQMAETQVIARKWELKT